MAIVLPFRQQMTRNQSIEFGDEREKGGQGVRSGRRRETRCTVHVRSDTCVAEQSDVSAAAAAAAASLEFACCSCLLSGRRVRESDRLVCVCMWTHTLPASSSDSEGNLEENIRQTLR